MNDQDRILWNWMVKVAKRKRSPWTYDKSIEPYLWQWVYTIYHYKRDIELSRLWIRDLAEWLP